MPRFLDIPVRALERQRRKNRLSAHIVPRFAGVDRLQQRELWRFAKPALRSCGNLGRLLELIDAREQSAPASIEFRRRAFGSWRRIMAGEIAAFARRPAQLRQPVKRG